MYQFNKRSEGRGIRKKFIIFMMATALSCLTVNVSYAKSIDGVNQIDQKEKTDFFIPLVNSFPQEQTTKLDDVLDDVINEKISEQNEESVQDNVLIMSDEIKIQPVAFDGKERRLKKYRRKISKIRKNISIDMNVSKCTGLSKKEFIKLASSIKDDKYNLYERNAGAIYDICKKYHINEIFFLGIIAEESRWGKSRYARATNNYTSQMRRGGGLVHFSSEKRCFESTARNLRNNYLSSKGRYYHGKSMRAINKVYCEPKKFRDGSKDKFYWSKEIVKCMNKIIS